MTKATKSRKNAAAVAASTTFALITDAGPSAAGNEVTEASVLENLLDEMIEDDGSAVTFDAGIVDDNADIIESAANPVIAEDALIEAIAHVEVTEAKQAVYAAQGNDEAAAGNDTPQELVDDPKAVKAAAKAAKKAERAKAAAEKKAAKAAAPVEPKVARATSVTHKPGALLLAKLGANARDFLTFNVSDTTLPEDTMHARQDEFIAMMNDSAQGADKVKEKIIMFMGWIQKGGDLNEVLKRTLTVLHEKGELTSGDKGNLQINLLSKPYSVGTARSQANQMFMALPLLGITVKEKGRMVANPDSVLLPMANAKLGLV